MHGEPSPSASLSGKSWSPDKETPEEGAGSPYSKASKHILAAYKVKRGRKEVGSSLMVFNLLITIQPSLGKKHMRT